MEARPIRTKDYRAHNDPQHNKKEKVKEREVTRPLVFSPSRQRHPTHKTNVERHVPPRADPVLRVPRTLRTQL